jgi:hypothetical protein
MALNLLDECPSTLHDLRCFPLTHAGSLVVRFVPKPQEFCQGST